MIITNNCYCGSNKTFASCCQIYINQTDGQQTFPQNPEKLMRSRFSAYASRNSQYIYDTYAESSKVSQSINEIDDWSNACVWIALQIHSTSEINDSSEQFVEFSAYHISEDTLFELRENSRFVLEIADKKGDKDESPKAQWRYIDGDIIKHTKLCKVKRKELCPCNSYPTAWAIKKGKKYKHCCGQL